MNSKATFILIYLSLIFCNNSFAQVKTGFVDEAVYTNLNIPVGLTFDESGRAYIWDKDGIIHHLMNNTKTTLIDIRHEVGSWYDNGLNGFALDPNYATNGYIYLLYVVDRHHLFNFGTSNYNYNTNDYESATIARVTRYTVSNPLTNPVVDMNSRHVLIGVDHTDGIPILTDNHGVGSLVFGTDGSLLISNGDGANVHVGNSNSPFGLQGRNDGIIRNDEALNHMRVQDINSLSGKILRIDPLTGMGLPSNPFYESANPNSDQSKVWAYGFRNPFRFTLKPETGSHNMADGDPGVLVVGEVGWNDLEEIDIVDGPGQNFGWPKFEGMSYEPNFGDFVPTLTGTHKQPIIEYPHSSSGVAKAKIGSSIYNFGTANFNYPDFDGVSIIGGVFYTGHAYPHMFHGKYFVGDYNTTGWVKTMDLDASNNPLNFEAFADGGASTNPTCFAMNPVDENIYYIRYRYSNVHELRRIRYSPVGGNAPTAVIQSNKISGTSPLTINFFGNLSTDPENNISSYEWDFGDGSPAVNTIDAVHTFNSAITETKTVSLKVTDSQGNENIAELVIHINNTPPVIISTTIDSLASVEAPTLSLNLDCEVYDLETPEANLTYEWTVELVHNDHSHVDATLNSKSASLSLPRTPDDLNLYYYRVNLVVTDANGLSTKVNKSIFFDINDNADLTPPGEIPNLKYTIIEENKGKLEWDTPTDDNGIYIYEVYDNETKLGDIRHGAHHYFLLDQQNGIERNFKVIARDSSGKVSPDKFLYFSFTNPTCAPSASCLFTDSTATLSPENLDSTYLSSGLSLSWDPVTAPDFHTYEVVLNGQKYSSGSATTQLVDHFSFRDGWNTIQIQSADNNNNRIVSSVLKHWSIACPDTKELTSPLDDITDEVKVLKGKLTIDAVNSITGNSAKVDFISEGNIQLNPGFKTDDGAVFKAEIKNCF